MWKIVLAISGCGLIVSCSGSSPSFSEKDAIDDINLRGQRMKAAPIVFVGIVRSASPVGELTPSTNVSGLMLQLYRARCQVELVIRGSVPDELDLWYFGPNPYAGIVGFPKFSLQPGQRRIFFAEVNEKVYRAVGDYLDYTEWVQSGKHDESIVHGDRDFGHTIARVMLTPGYGFNADDFAQYLVNAKISAELFSSRSYTSDLLRALSIHEHKAIRREACRLLATDYDDTPESCLAFGRTGRGRNAK